MIIQFSNCNNIQYYIIEYEWMNQTLADRVDPQTNPNTIFEVLYAII